MQKNSKLPKRSEISENYKWRLQDIYKTDELWESDFEKVKELTLNLSKFKG